MSLPVPWGRVTTPRTIWLAFRGSTPKRTAKSMDASNFTLVISFTKAEPPPGNRVCSSLSWPGLPFAFWSILPFINCFKILKRFGPGNSDAHGSCGTRYHTHGGFHRECIQIDHLFLGDLFDQIPGHCSVLNPVRFARAFFNLCRFHQLNCRRWCLYNELK